VEIVSILLVGDISDRIGEIANREFQSSTSLEQMIYLAVIVKKIENETKNFFLYFIAKRIQWNDVITINQRESTSLQRSRKWLMLAFRLHFGVISSYV
jgi:hypothetical protein